MSYLRPVRQRIENILLGNHGANPYTIEQGRFHLASNLPSLSDEPENVSERAISIEIGPQRPYVPFNLLDGFGIFEHDVEIKVSYQLTNAGDIDAENLTSQDGAGTIQAIRDRVSTDANDILCALAWTDNLANLNPQVINLYPGDSFPGTSQEDGQFILSIPMKLLLHVTLRGTYGQN